MLKELNTKAEELKSRIAKQAEGEARYYQGAIEGINLLLNSVEAEARDDEKSDAEVTEISKNTKSGRSKKKD